jgi:hypothetical protein
LTTETPAEAQAPAPLITAPPLPDHFNGEDPLKINDLCQKRSDDALPQKTKNRKRTTEAYAFIEGNPYDLSNSMTADQRWFSRQGKTLITEVVGTICENGLEVKVKADPPPDCQDPEFLQATQIYAEQFGLDPEDRGENASEMLSHTLRTLDKKMHIDVLTQRYVERCLTDAPGAVYSYVGVSLYSDSIVVDELVPAEQIWLDQNADDFYECEWMRRDWPVTLERLINKFPEHEAYFREHLGDGKEEVKKVATSSTFETDWLQEHLFKNWEMIPDENGGLKAKYPGHIMRVWRYGQKVLRIAPLKNLHEENPYDQLIGVTKMKGPEGQSFALDILYGPVMAKNRATNTALDTAEIQGKGKRLMDTGALVNPNDATDDTLSTIPVMPGYDLNSVVKDLVGADISPAVKGIMAEMQAEIERMTGQTPQAGTVPSDASDAAKAGRIQAPFRTRLRDFVERRAKKKVFDVIQFDDRERAWQTMGNVGPPVTRFWTGIFMPIIENLEAYFTIEVTDKKPNTTDPVKQAEIFKIMREAALELAQNPLAPMPYSKALEMGPEFEGKDRMVRVARIAEAEQKKAAEEAAQNGQPDPQMKALAANNQKVRGDGEAELAKKNLQDLSALFGPNVALMNLTGASDQFFKIAQGEAPALSMDDALKLLASYGIQPNLGMNPATVAADPTLPPEDEIVPELGGASDPTIQPEAPTLDAPMEQGITQ